MLNGQYTNYLANAMLDHVHGGGNYTRPATIYLAALKAGDVEVTGGSYARLAVTNNSTNFPAAVNRAKANGAVLAFAQATADWGLIVAIAAYDAASGGNQLWKVPLAGNEKFFLADGSDNTLNSEDHGLTQGQRVTLAELSADAPALPVNLAANTVYFVRDVTQHSFKLSATDGGSAIAAGYGAGRVATYKAREVYDGDTLSFAIGDLTIFHA
ncbi:MAG: hypothetical protein KIT44_15925 [Opitutaceae bacterium]|nr:hypothetical protein [Opitutaceae bacterium]